MSQMHFCYVCRIHHPAEEMSVIHTRAGRRWRCLRSIAAAKTPSAERDAFGSIQTEINQALARHMAQKLAVLRWERRHLL
jgi:hypothetical protein